MADKALDLAGPGIGSYEEVDKILPSDYASLLDRKRTQKAIYDVKEYIEKGLAEELNLMFVQVPLIVEVASG
ncbi:MAG: aspartate--ammonia ligase, partial [Gammaproteobacteria bacterium]|nr:aspartate--ammonia ligase [Gammaproteobacteria bacterium]